MPAVGGWRHCSGRAGAEGVTAYVSHLLTPETATSTHYFWTFARDSGKVTSNSMRTFRQAFRRPFSTRTHPSSNGRRGTNSYQIPSHLRVIFFAATPAQHVLGEWWTSLKSAG